MIAGDFIIVRHALIHLGKLTLQLTRCAVKHHQHGRRAEGPAAAGLDADRLPRHLRAGTPVQAAHGADIVVAEKTHDQVAFSPQIAFFLCGKRCIFGNRRQQQLLQLIIQLQNTAGGPRHFYCRHIISYIILYRL